MRRQVTSNVSALSGCVANGHQALHHVSSSPSEIPYGGFSPVRLQTGLGPSSSPTGAHPQAYRRPESRSFASVIAPTRGAIAVLSRRAAAIPRDRPVQRPLARRRVVLSRQVVAYYGLIRGSRTLPTTYALRRRVFALRPRPGDSLLYSACPSLRAVFRTPADRMAKGCSTSIRDSLRPFVRGSASAASTQKSVHAWRVFEAAKFALRCGPERCLPFTDKDVYVRAFIPRESPQWNVEYDYAANSQSTATDLASAGQAALQAATRMDTKTRSVFILI